MPAPSRLWRAVIGIAIVAILYALLHLSWQWAVVLLLIGAIAVLWPVAWRTIAILLVIAAFVALWPQPLQWILERAAPQGSVPAAAAPATSTVPAVAPVTQPASPAPITTAPAPVMTTAAPPVVATGPADSVSFYVENDDGSITYLGAGIERQANGVDQPINQGDTYLHAWQSGSGQLTIDLNPTASYFGAWTTDGTHFQQLGGVTLRSSAGVNQIVINLPSGTMVAVATRQATWQTVNVGTPRLTSANGLATAYTQVKNNATPVVLDASGPTTG